MCFSAPVSFAASALLIPTGLYAVRVASKRNSSYIPFAFMPIGFGIQQACEGVTWLGIHANNSLVTQTGTLGFLVFALWVWLFAWPWAVARVEPNPNTRRFCVGLGILGFMYGAVTYLPFLVQPERLSIQVVQHSIQYDGEVLLNAWIPQLYSILIYMAIFLLSFVLASNPAIKFLGALVFILGVLSFFFLTHAFVSLWCFFAAILSVVILYICQTAPMPQTSTKTEHLPVEMVKQL